MTMFAAELYKIRHHRMPWMLAAAGVLITGASSIYFVLRPPESSADYVATSLEVLGLYGVLAGAMLGGWIIGHEYRQHTMRRVLALDARRSLVVGTKAAAGAGVLLVIIAALLAVAIGGGALAAAVNGDGFVASELPRTVAAQVFPVVVAAAVAFALSLIFRSETYSILASLGLLVILSPLLGALPTVGDYTPGLAVGELVGSIADSVPPKHGVGITAAVVVGWVAAFWLIGDRLFANRDV